MVMRKRVCIVSIRYLSFGDNTQTSTQANNQKQRMVHAYNAALNNKKTRDGSHNVMLTFKKGEAIHTRYPRKTEAGSSVCIPYCQLVDQWRVQAFFGILYIQLFFRRVLLVLLLGPMVCWVNNVVEHNMGLPTPRPIGPPAAGASAALGLLIVSSTDNIMQAASAAAVKALILIIDGSQTHSRKLSEMSSFIISTPYHWQPKSARQYVYSGKRNNRDCCNLSAVKSKGQS
uniref:Uncharacterized protein n=1 Tax=Glossina brevipalpis TaxID=37001 RepID=A0A1A9W6R4_9MUSC